MTKPIDEKIRKPFDAAEFERLFMQHYSWLCATAYYIVNDEEYAKDIVQDFFLYCWSKQIVLDKPEFFSTYAYRSIRNASLNYRSRGRKIRFEDPIALEHVQKSDDGHPDEPDMFTSKAAIVWEVIGNLPVQRRNIFLLSNRDGLKYTEIAAELNISVNTVKTQIKLAYQFLRQECKWMVPPVMLIVMGTLFDGLNYLNLINVFYGK